MQESEDDHLETSEQRCQSDADLFGGPVGARPDDADGSEERKTRLLPKHEEDDQLDACGLEERRIGREGHLQRYVELEKRGESAQSPARRTRRGQGEEGERTCMTAYIATVTEMLTAAELHTWTNFGEYEARQ